MRFRIAIQQDPGSSGQSFRNVMVYTDKSLGEVYNVVRDCFAKEMRLRDDDVAFQKSFRRLKTGSLQVRQCLALMDLLRQGKPFNKYHLVKYVGLGESDYVKFLVDNKKVLNSKGYLRDG